MIEVQTIEFNQFTSFQLFIHITIAMLAELLSIIAVISCILYGALFKRFHSKINYWKKMGVPQNDNIQVE